jgi:hypothetical protein
MGGPGRRVVVVVPVLGTTRAGTVPPAESNSAAAVEVLSDLVRREYPPATLEDIARAICREVRTGTRDTALPWREMIGYVGERRVGAFVGYSVASYCPEEGRGVFGLMSGGLGQG